MKRLTSDSEPICTRGRISEAKGASTSRDSLNLHNFTGISTCCYNLYQLKQSIGVYGLQYTLIELDIICWFRQLVFRVIMIGLTPLKNGRQCHTTFLPFPCILLDNGALEHFIKSLKPPLQQSHFSKHSWSSGTEGGEPQQPKQTM